MSSPPFSPADLRRDPALDARALALRARPPTVLAGSPRLRLHRLDPPRPRAPRAPPAAPQHRRRPPPHFRVRRVQPRIQRPPRPVVHAEPDGQLPARRLTGAVALRGPAPRRRARAAGRRRAGRRGGGSASCLHQKCDPRLSGSGVRWLPSYSSIDVLHAGTCRPHDSVPSTVCASGHDATCAKTTPFQVVPKNLPGQGRSMDRTYSRLSLTKRPAGAACRAGWRGGGSLSPLPRRTRQRAGPLVFTVVDHGNP